MPAAATNKSKSKKALPAATAKQVVSIGDLVPDRANCRRHNPRNLGSIVNSLNKVGAARSIVIDEDNVILAGNGMVEAAGEAGITKVQVGEADGNTVIAVRRTGLTAKQKAELAIADNRTAELAEWDAEQLLATIAEHDIDLAGIEFTEEELGEIATDAADAKPVVEDIPKAKGDAEARSRTGDLWALGRHRVLCGDSTNRADVMRLMGDKRAAMVFTDPPYNVAYEGKTKDALRIVNDSMSGDKFRAFLRDAFAAMFEAATPGAPIYVCHADSEGLNFRAAFAEAGWQMKQCLIWVKNCLVLGRQDYQWRHEPILYGWKPGSHYWRGGRKQTTIIDNAAGITESKDEQGIALSFQTGVQTVVIRVP